MIVKKPTKPNDANTPAHRCEWGNRNPKNHLSFDGFASLLSIMLTSNDHQHITCPGCGRSIYLSIKIEGHNKLDKKGKVERRSAYYPPFPQEDVEE